MWLSLTSYLTLYVTVDLRGIFDAREYIYVMHTAYYNSRGRTLRKKKRKHTGLGGRVWVFKCFSPFAFNNTHTRTHNMHKKFHTGTHTDTHLP